LKDWEKETKDSQNNEEPADDQNTDSLDAIHSIDLFKADLRICYSYYREHKIDYISNSLKLSLRAQRAWQSRCFGLLRRLRSSQ
jgi:hypothetical protein